MFGFVNCNKPIGFTSRDVVNIVQGKLRGRRIKVGHCGTLDPLADGVLVVGVGAAAKLMPYVHETAKRYQGTFQLGAESPTGDLEVEPTVYTDHPIPTIEELRSQCQSLLGTITQTPPAYSAIKIDGKRAYDLVRKGKEVQMPSRQVQIRSLEIIDYEYPRLVLDICCGTGTYIRTLGMDLARLTGTTAVMTGLTRLSVGEFQIQDAVEIDTIRESEMESLLSPASQGVAHMGRLIVDEDECERLANGQRLSYRTPESSPEPHTHSNHVAALSRDHRLVAILVEQDNAWRPKKVFYQQSL